MRHRRPWKIFLQDMLVSCQKIQMYVKNTNLDDFVDQSMKVDAVVRNLEILGEAVTQIPETVRKERKTIPWKKIKAMRNLLSHEYFGIDAKIVWKTVQDDIPRLEESLQSLLNDIT